MSAEERGGNVTANRDIVAGNLANVINIYHQAAPEPPGLTDEAFTCILTDYLNWVPDFHGQARLFGGAPMQRELRDVFTPFTLRRFVLEGDLEAWPDDVDNAAERMRLYLQWVSERGNKGKRVDTQDLLLEGDRLAVIGGAGSGKSALLAHIACNLARAATTGVSSGFRLEADQAPPSLGGPQLPIPLLVPLRMRRQYLTECAKTVGKGIDDPVQGRIRGFIPWALARQSDGRFNNVGDFVDRLLRGGAFLLMLDGLDEVVDRKDRSNLRQEIEDLMRSYPAVRIIVTSRDAGYRERAMFSDNWTRLDVQPLDEDQIAFLVSRWCDKLYPTQEQAARNVTDLLVTIENLEKRRLVRELSPLINSPLMVTMVVSVRYVENRPLPGERSRLYERCVEVLLQAQYQPDDAARDEVAEWGGPWDSQRDWLAHLAHDMHRKGVAGAVVTEEDVARILRPEVEEEGLNLARFITAVRQRGGLLEERGDLFQFLHLTFQEFLAARYIAKRREEGWADLDERLSDSWWRETLLLIHGFASFDDRKTAAAYLAWLMRVERRPELRIAGLELAGSATLERDRVTDLDRRQVAEHIAAALFDPALQLPPQHSYRRAAAGKVLSALGDPRPEVLETTKMALCWVPAGPFWMGSDMMDDIGFDNGSADEQPHIVDMPNGYWISKYPVTQSQFKEFLTHPDYLAKRFWNVAGAANGVDPTYRGQLDQDNHPVVDVTWYQALAYAAWSEEQLKSAGRLEEFGQILLPSEVEWEKAARGGIRLPAESLRTRLISSGDMPLSVIAAVTLEEQDPSQARRRYPWGEDPDPDRANCRETNVGSSSAVDCFPGGGSVYGCQDMSGNVWEWTRSRWGPPPYPCPGVSRHEREDLSGGDACLRVLRGGPFRHSHQFASCSFRVATFPYFRGRLGGFRLVVSPFHSEP